MIRTDFGVGGFVVEEYWINAKINRLLPEWIEQKSLFLHKWCCQSNRGLLFVVVLGGRQRVGEAEQGAVQ